MHRPRARGALGYVALVIVLLTALLVVSDYYLIVLESTLAFAIACLALKVLLGYGGLLSVGHAAYFGVVGQPAEQHGHAASVGDLGPTTSTDS